MNNDLQNIAEDNLEGRANIQRMKAETNTFFDNKEYDKIIEAVDQLDDVQLRHHFFENSFENGRARDIYCFELKTYPDSSVALELVIKQ